LISLSLNGSRILNREPDSCLATTNKEVLSLPDGDTLSLPRIKNLVMFPVLSSIFLASLSRLYKPSAASDAIAAALDY